MTFQLFVQKLQRFTPQKAAHLLRYNLWRTDSTLLLVRPQKAALESGSLFQGSWPVEIHPVTEQNLRDCDQFHDCQHNSEIFSHLLQRGDLGYYGYLNDTCVSCLWVKRSGPISYAGAVARELSSEEALIHFVYVAPTARGKSIQAFLIRHALDVAGTPLNFYALVDSHNVPSLKNFLKTGFSVQSHVIVKHRFFRVHTVCLPVSTVEMQSFLKPEDKKRREKQYE